MKIKFLHLLLASALTLRGQYEAKPRYPDEVKPGRLAIAIAGETSLYLGSMVYLQYVWYKDTERVPFHFYNDNAGYLQVDKFGHAFGSYIESYVGYYWMRHAGVRKNKALLFGGTLGFILQTPIEIYDGIYDGWGFSWGDMVANAAGSALLIGQELAWNEQVVKLKFSFHRSRYADDSNGMLGDTYLQSLLYDYNGHSYWLSTGLNRFVKSPHIPDWLNVAAGYSANGMYGEFENYETWGGHPLPQAQRYRQFLLSLDIDWPEIETNSKFLNAVFDGMFFIKLPFPTFEVNSRGQAKAYWIYF